MKKRLTALLTAIFCMSESLTAIAAYTAMDASFTYSTDLFAYTSQTFESGCSLTSELADPDFMVVGMTYYANEPDRIFGYVVCPMNAYADWDVGIFQHQVIEEEIGEVQLEVGDLLQTKGELCCSAIYPTTYMFMGTEGTITHLGNGVDIFGEEFKKVIRLQMVIEQADFDERHENGAIYNIDLIKGDVTIDDSVNILDCIVINKHLLTGTELCDYAKFVGDIDANGKLDFTDSLAILKESIGITVDFE